MLAQEFIENLKMSVNDRRDQSTFNQKRTVEQNPIYPGKVDKENKSMNALADCKSATIISMCFGFLLAERQLKILKANGSATFR